MLRAAQLELSSEETCPSSKVSGMQHNWLLPEPVCVDCELVTNVWLLTNVETGEDVRGRMTDDAAMRRHANRRKLMKGSL